MEVLLFLLKSSKRDFVLALITGLLAGASFSGIVALIHLIIQTELSQFYLYLFGFIACWLGYGIFSPASTYFLSQLSEKATLKLRLELSQQILETPLDQIENNKADIFVVLTEDINAISLSLERLPGYFAAAAIVVGCFLVMVFISPLLCLLLLVILILFVPFYLLSARQMKLYLSKTRGEWNNIFNHFYSLNHGIKELLINDYKKQDFLDNHLYPSCYNQYQQAIRYKTIDVAVARWGELFLLAGLGALIFSLPPRGLITFRQISEFLFILLFTLPHLNTILGLFNQIRRIDVSLQHIKEIGLILGSEKSTVQRILTESYQTLPDTPQSLTLTDISYQYYDLERDHPFSISSISLSFQRPGIVFITGGNGSGKSTFIKILCGLYKPDKGQIHVDNVEISNSNQALYRQYFSVIFSDFYLFDSLLGLNHKVIENEIKDYLIKLELTHKVKVDSRKFSTTKLSQGQRKRLALLSSLIEDKEIYIFDEWASDQDPYFKKIFYHQVLADLKAKNKLVFVVSHDESYYYVADRIIKLADGQVVEDSD